MIKFLKSLTLFLLALTLFTVFAPIGIICGLLQAIWKLNFEYFSKILFNGSVVFDRLGNVVCEIPLNYVMIKSRYNRYNLFGNMSETVSHNLGENKRVGNLTKFGELVGALLAKLGDKGYLKKLK